MIPCMPQPRPPLARKRSALSAAALVLALGPCRLGFAQEIAPLLDKLAEKGVLTGEERRELQSRLEQKAPVLPFSLRVSGQIQARFSAQRNDPRGVEQEDSFRIRRAKLALDGVLVEDVEFKLELDASREAVLEDAEIRFRQLPQAELTVGQFKLPFSMENIASDKKLDFVERAEAVKALAPDRDIGLAVRGAFLDKRLGYAAAFVNGNGKNKKTNDNDQFLSVLRLEGAPLRNMRLGGADLSVVLGGNVAASSDGEARADEIFGVKKALGTSSAGRRLVGGADFSARAGRASLKMEFIAAQFKPVNRALREIEAAGFYVQGGWFLKARLQAVARYETYDPDRRIDSEKDLRWTTLGLNWFIRGHDLRLQGNYIFKKEDGPAVRDDSFLVMLQLLF